MSTDKEVIVDRSNFWALLVGIDHYEAAPGLLGCVNDIRAMYDFLTRNLQVPEERVRVLTSDDPDALPTRHRIITTFQDFLINNPNIERGDQILFYFSGHGSQMRDTTGLEPDGYSETLVAMDSRNAGVWDIPDKTVAAMLDQLAEKKGDNITVILDCCHSGSGTRKLLTAGAALVRQVAPDYRLPPADLDADILSGAPRRNAGPSGWPTQKIPYTLLAACRDKEKASEYLPVDTEAFEPIWYGVMSYFTLNAMRQMRPGTSYAQLYEQVAVRVSSLYAQMPQCEGQRNREVFGNSYVEQAPFILVRNINGQITVEAGLIHQVHPGDKLALYPHDVRTRAGLPPNPLATIEVVSVTATTSRAKVIKGDEDIPLLTRGLVIEVVYTGQVQIVALHAGEVDETGNPLPEEQIESNRAAIARLRGFLERYPSPYLKIADNPDQPAELRVEAVDGQYGLYNAKGELLILPGDIRARDDVSAVISTLESIARYRAVLELTNREAGSQLAGRIKVSLCRLVDGEAKDLPEEAVEAGGELTLSFDSNCQENNCYVVVITNSSPLDVYPHVLVLNPDYSIYILYPKMGEQNAIAPNHTLSIGLGRGQQRLEIYLPDGWESSRDYLKIIATTQPADVSILEQEGLNVPPRRSSPTRVIKSPLDKLLDTVALGARTRFGRPVQTPTGEDWATVEFSYKVARPSQTVPLAPEEPHIVDL